MTDWISLILVPAGLFFYLAGGIGLIRLSDPYCRLHALTKADNLGLGLLTLGVLLQVDDLLTGLKLLLIGWLVLIASAAGSQLIAQYAHRSEQESKG